MKFKHRPIDMFETIFILELILYDNDTLQFIFEIPIIKERQLQQCL